MGLGATAPSSSVVETGACSCAAFHLFPLFFFCPIMSFAYQSRGALYVCACVPVPSTL